MPTDKTENHKEDTEPSPTSPVNSTPADSGSQNTTDETVGSNARPEYEENSDRAAIVTIDKIPTLRIAEDKEFKDLSRTANTISRFSVFVNSILAVCTITLAAYAIKQAISADTSAKTALKTYISDSTNSQRVYRRDSINEAKSDTIDSIKQVRYNELVHAQIGSFEEAKKEFEIENKPLIQILNIHDTLQTGKKIKIGFDFINYGKQPVKVLINKFQIELVKRGNHFINHEKDYQISSINQYLSGSVRVNGAYQTNFYAKDISPIKNGEYGFYLNGQLTFQNTVTHRKSIYQYRYKIQYEDGNFGVLGEIDTTIDVNPIKK